MKFTTKIIAFAFLLFTIVSCEDYVGGEINADPNKPSTVPISAQIPSIQINLADVYGGAFSRNNCMLIQQVEGVARCGSFNQYTGMTPTRFRNVWTNIYENILVEIKLAQAAAEENEFNHYLGMLNTLEAYTLMIATDVWDDMPYSEAFEGNDNFNPKYDSQSEIYTAIYQLLDEAEALFDKNAGGLAIGNDDVYYEGDIEKWKKAIHGIRARGFLKENKYTDAAAEAKLSFSSPDDNLGFLYPDENAASPWYRYNRDRTGDIEFHPVMRNMMYGLNDTARLNILNEVFRTNHSYMTAEFHQELLTYREMQFIIAEADIRLNSGGTQEGFDAYLEGISAGFEELNLPKADFSTYVAQSQIAPGAGNMTLEHVLLQKYIGTYLSPEAYSDWRRTGYPYLTPVSGSEIPVRWEYSADEYSFNSNAPAIGTVSIYTDRVGWNR